LQPSAGRIQHNVWIENCAASAQNAVLQYDIPVGQSSLNYMTYRVYTALNGFKKSPVPSGARLAAASQCNNVIAIEEKNRSGKKLMLLDCQSMP
jgi:hypothetical protein